jgi:hypothetical protein
MKRRFVGYSAVLGLCALSATAATIALPAGGDFQAALDSARAGDVITIRTSAADSSLPASGVRITPAYGSLLPKLVTGHRGCR